MIKMCVNPLIIGHASVRTRRSRPVSRTGLTEWS